MADRVDKDIGRIQKDNRGITLVELIIAMTVSVIIMGCATLFMNSAQKSFQNASNTIDLQMEAQIAMERLSQWVMEGNGIRTGVGEFVVYDIDRQPGNNNFGIYPSGMAWPHKSCDSRIVWQADGTLYTKCYGDVQWKSDTKSVRDPNPDQKMILAEHVSSLDVQLSADKTKVMITLVMKEGKQSCTLENEFTLRNEWMLD